MRRSMYKTTSLSLTIQIDAPQPSVQLATSLHLASVRRRTCRVIAQVGFLGTYVLSAG